MRKYGIIIIILVIAALCKASQAPLSALLLQECTPLMSFAFICLGSLFCAALTFVFTRKSAKKEPASRHLQKKDMPYVIIRIISEVLGGILFIVGLTMCLASEAALVKSFTIVAAAIIAFLVFKEKISRKLGISIILITLGCVTIASGSIESFIFSPGILLVLASAICGALNDNIGRKLAERNPGEVLLVIEFFVTILAFAVAFICGEKLLSPALMLSSMLAGAIIYGAYRILYQVAARHLGAAKCSTVTGLAPIIGAGMSLVIFQEEPTLAFIISLILLIPGFYLVISDREDKIQGIENPESLSKQEKYHDVRNFITGIGLLAIFTIELLFVFELVQYLLSGTLSTISLPAGIAVSILLIVIGCLLFILRHRDLAAIVMFFFGFMMISIIISGEDSIFYQGLLGVIVIILAAILLLAKDRKKYYYSLLFLITGVTSLIYTILGISSIVPILILHSVNCVYLIILATASSGLLPRFKLTGILAEDETMSYKKSASAVCYLIIAASILPWIGISIFGADIVPRETVQMFSIGCAIMLAVISILLIFIGKIRFTGAIFLGISLFLVIAGSTADMMNYAAGIVMFLLGLACFLRKKSYLMLGLMCVLYGISSFTSFIIHGETVLLLSQFLMYSLTFLLAVYLAVAVFSQNKKLPLY